MCDRFVDSWFCEVPKVWWHTCHTLGTYRHTLGISAELPKVSWLKVVRWFYWVVIMWHFDQANMLVTNCHVQVVKNFHIWWEGKSFPGVLLIYLFTTIYIRFRLRNHRLAIETGSWFNIGNNYQNCLNCDELEDEEHFDCTAETIWTCKTNKYF